MGIGKVKIEIVEFVIRDIDEKTYYEIDKEFRDVGFMTWNHSRNEQGKYTITGSVRSQQEADKVFSILSFYLPEENGH